MAIQDEIEEFIIKELSGGRATVGLDDPLISSGIVDSLGLLRLIGFIEEQGGLAIGDGEVGPENFDTIRRISSFVDRKRTVSRGTTPVASPSSGHE